MEYRGLNSILDQVHSQGNYLICYEDTALFWFHGKLSAKIIDICLYPFFRLPNYLRKSYNQYKGKILWSH